MTDFTELAGSLIFREGKLLLLHRPEHSHWEVPGGKVEDEESPTEAAVREASEVGLEVELEKPFFSGEFQHDDQLFLWHGYIASTEDEPVLRENKFSELKWVSRGELRELDLAPNLEMIRPGLRRVLK